MLTRFGASGVILADLISNNSIQLLIITTEFVALS